MNSAVCRLGFLVAVLASGVLAEVPPTRYAVVCEETYTNEKKFSVMAEAEYRAAAKRAFGESALLHKALNAARREWKETEYKRTGGKTSSANWDKNKQSNKGPVWGIVSTDNGRRRKPFPSLKLNMSPSFRCLGFHEDKTDADARCAKLADSASRRLTLSTGSSQLGNFPSRLKKPERSSTKSSEREADKTKAMAMFEAHLARVRVGGKVAGGSGGRSVKRLGEGSTSLGRSSSFNSSDRSVKRMGNTTPDRFE
ncbi:MAG: hypothetical protein QGH42_07825 [Kiritimatiellia bacterium]|nr:hypothetical protein [Kiritimatiellia bacterium]MDP6810789.1 hypothetical protein [Kiritimatiellia bacterium]MDP7024131.1 hypothetical protein [Kiritimatiellia bacterium]